MSASRNKREGRYVGFAWGRRVRLHGLNYATKPRSILALEALRVRRRKRIQVFIARRNGVQTYIDALDGALSLNDPRLAR